MRLFLMCLGVMLLIPACSDRGTQAVYDLIHERERQQCLQQGRSDCPRAENYNKYKQQRDEILHPDNPEQLNQ